MIPMPEMIVSALVEGGKASAGPPLGPALGPTGINIGEVIKEINDKTKDYIGIQVPVDVVINTGNKTFTIKVGSPPVSALLKKELGVDTMQGIDIPIDYAIKIARMKKENMLANSDRAAVKEVLGTCQSMGMTIDGKAPKEVQKDVDAGKYDAKIDGKEELTLLSGEELANLKAELKKMEEEKAKEAEEAEAAKKEAEGEAAEGAAEEAKPEEGKKEEKVEEKKEEPDKDQGKA